MSGPRSEFSGSGIRFSERIIIAFTLTHIAAGEGARTTDNRGGVWQTNAWRSGQQEDIVQGVLVNDQFCEVTLVGVTRLSVIRGKCVVLPSG